MGNRLAPMESEGQGISQLLQAEREAAAMVTAAKKAKQEKLNLAKVQAQEEINKYKETLEADYEQHKKDHGSSSGQSQQAVEAQTNKTINDLKQQASMNQDKVVQLLVQYVTKVN